MKDNKRTRILEAATRVFAKKGFYNATISDVAQVAEVAEGTIYLYFKSKDDLLISLFEHSIDLFKDEVEAELKGVDHPEEKLRKFIALHLKLVQKNQDLAQVLQIELRQSSKFMKEYKGGKFADYLNIIRGIIEEGQARGLFREELDPRILRRAIFGAVDEMALEWVLMHKKRYSIEQCAEQMSELFVKGLKETL